MPEIKWNADLYTTQHNFVFKYGEDVIKWLAPAAGEKIIDIGCGTGQLTNEIKNFGTEVTGIDASAEMIAKAKENYPGIDFYVKDATDFSFDEQFDAAFSNATLHWINKQEAALKCIYGCLKKGGRFVFEMGGKHNIESIHDAIKKVFEAEKLDDKISSTSNYFPSVAEQAGLLEKTGFTVSDVAYFKRPTKLEGGDGMKKWIEQFCGFFFGNVSKEQKEMITAKAVEELKKTNYTGNTWYADYIRLRIKAIKN